QEQKMRARQSMFSSKAESKTPKDAGRFRWPWWFVGLTAIGCGHASAAKVETALGPGYEVRCPKGKKCAAKADELCGKRGYDTVIQDPKRLIIHCKAAGSKSTPEVATTNSEKSGSSRAPASALSPSKIASQSLPSVVTIFASNTG